MHIAVFTKICGTSSHQRLETFSGFSLRNVKNHIILFVAVLMLLDFVIVADAVSLVLSFSNCCCVVS